MDDFQKTIAAYLEKDSNNKRKLANHFGIMMGTVSAWATGVARPHPEIQKLIVRFIKQQLGE